MGDKIPMVNEAKFLGVTFDQKLTFLPHLRNLKSRCLKFLKLLKVLGCSSWRADKCSVLRIYRAFVCSKLDYGCIVYGSAFVCQDEIVAEQISSNSSIFTAELHAIHLALNYVIRKGHCRCVIYTDSVSALQALISCEPCSHCIVIKIRKLFSHLLARNFSIKFCWVPGHVGIRGNEEADAAAKSASPPQHTMRIEGGDFKLVIKKRLAERWQNMWNAQVHNKLHEIKPTIENWTHKKFYNRRSEVIITRLRIGHTRLTHQYLLKGDEQPVCQYCNCPLTVKHILLDCSVFETRRRQHFGNANFKQIRVRGPIFMIY
ncbi:uncharacterized protein LOC111622440 [Centruroides sculpturatus]|uniref:uncharacterized protein LOC111622440 n=1 Tax=Centruroides sculpturatus TaxID=218467 RepID=UPI000C6EBD05|nr:uncharacterized protein LOC111622440 [Centruroides sculpturatus]